MSNFYYKILVVLSLVSTGWAYSCYMECGDAFTRIEQELAETEGYLRYMDMKLDRLEFDYVETQKCR